MVHLKEFSQVAINLPEREACHALTETASDPYAEEDC